MRTSCSSTVSLPCVSEESLVTSSSSPSVWSSHWLSAASCRSNSILWSAIESTWVLLASPADGLVTANETASMPLRLTVTVCEPDADVDTISSTPEFAIFDRHQSTPTILSYKHSTLYSPINLLACKLWNNATLAKYSLACQNLKNCKNREDRNIGQGYRNKYSLGGKGQDIDLLIKWSPNPFWLPVQKYQHNIEDSEVNIVKPYITRKTVWYCSADKIKI